MGKLVGVSGAAWLAVRTKAGRLPDDVRWPHIVGVGALADIGYTVSLFIADWSSRARTLWRRPSWGSWLHR